MKNTLKVFRGNEIIDKTNSVKRVISKLAVVAVLSAGAAGLQAQRPLGVDVSSYQPGINWTDVVASGISFAFVKAAEGTATDGWIGEDPDYIYNMNNATPAGMLVSSYYYAHPESDPGSAGADAEAAFFWSVAGPYMKNGGKYLMPMLDFEQDVSGAGYTAATLSSWLNEWCQDIVNDGADVNGVALRPIVYTYISYANGGSGVDPGLTSAVTQWPLDMANVNFTEAEAQTGAPAATYPWSTWNFWQYNWYGVVPGITQEVDLDVFNGTSTTLQSYVIGGAASFYYWDPQGTSGSNPYTGNMTSAWERVNWSIGPGGQSKPSAWVEGQAVCFGVNTGLGTPPFTVTATINHTFAGIFIGPLSPNSCTVTINGKGILTLAGGPQGFYVIQAGDGSAGNLTISNVIAGTGQFTAESGPYTAGQIYLNGTNTFSGGVQLGYPPASVAWTGVIYFNNSASFGTGPITLQSTGSGSAFVAEGTAPIAIANPVTVASSTTNNFVGNAAGVTYAGNWTLGGNSLTFLTGSTAGNVDIISGVISGSGSLAVADAGTLILSGANTYTGPTSVKAGKLALGAGGSIGASVVTVSSGATLSDATTNTVNIGGTTTLNSGAAVSFAGSGGASSTIGRISVGGNLALNGNTVTVNVSGSALKSGTYRLMSCAGSLSGSVAANVTITGIPLGAGYTATVKTTTGAAGHVDLIVKMPPFSITSAALDSSGSNFILTWQAAPGESYHIVGTTNLTNPLSAWTNVISGIAATATNVAVTNPIAAPANFFKVVSP